jgi:myo-inositol-1(or 4)-monophosphatase
MDVNLNAIIEAAEAGGRELKKYFGQVLDLVEKSTIGDYQTRADTESERVVLEILQKHFPDYNIHSEETGKIKKGSRFTFVIDPLDGSHNFVIGVPNFTVAIALFEEERIVAGVIHAPMISHTYHAELGKGAFHDGKRLKVSTEKNTSRAVISQTMGWLGSDTRFSKIWNRNIDDGIMRIINNWSPEFDFCLLASGRIEAIINDGSDLYDFAAGKLIAREAGAVFSDFEGSPDTDKNPTFLCSNNHDIHAALLERLRNAGVKNG